MGLTVMRAIRQKNIVTRYARRVRARFIVKPLAELKNSSVQLRRLASLLSPRSNRALGIYGEWIAFIHLKMHGYTIRHRNWTHHRGELDIIAIKHDTLVIIEVKTRKEKKSSAFSPFDSVDHRKNTALFNLGNHYRKKFARELRRLGVRKIRFDIIGVVVPKKLSLPSIEHRKGITEEIGIS